MSKEKIAIDIDDVLGQTTDALRIFVNEREGLSLTSEDYTVSAAYWGYYEHVWVNAGITDETHLEEFHKNMGINQDNISVVDGSQSVVGSMASRYELIAVTSREQYMEEATRRWLKRNYGEAFEQVVLLGHAGSASKTKGEACSELGASWLIDDNHDHCLSAVEAGVGALLFGKYGWNSSQAPLGIHRYENWELLGKYFDGKS